MFEQLKKATYEANMLLQKYQLVIHTWGNVSQRSDDQKYIAIKPSGVAYATMKWQDMVVIEIASGKIVEGTLKPSSDLDTHLYMYQQDDQLQAMVHTHSLFAVAWAQSGQSIDCLGTTHADHFYGPIACTRELNANEVNNQYELNTGRVIWETMQKQQLTTKANPAILVKHHGPFTFSNKSGIDAVNVALTLEEVAKMAYYTKQIGNNEIAPKYLQDKHYNRKHGKNAYYGQKN